MTDQPLYEFTTIDMARAFSVSTVSIRKWAERGVLTGMRTPGGRLRFSHQDIEALRRRLALQPARAEAAEPV